MAAHSLQQSTETDTTYWLGRVASLEKLVCELLAKNQRMRFALEAPAQERLPMEGATSAKGSLLQGVSAAAWQGQQDAPRKGLRTDRGLWATGLIDAGIP